MNNVTDPAISLTVQTLLDERHALRDRSAHQPVGSGQWIGQFRSARRGQGTEFDDLRHYSAGDDTRHIDWKASARTNVIHTRLYREEREYRTKFIVDMRDTVFTGTTELQAVRLCRLAARLLWQANDCGSKTQVLLVTDDGLLYNESGSGHKSAINACSLIAHVFACRQNELSKHTDKHKVKKYTSEEPKTSSKNLSSSPINSDQAILYLPKKFHQSGYHTVHLDQVTEWLLQQNGKHASVFWVSAFEHCGVKFDQHISLLSQHSTQIAIVVEDDIVQTGLPPGHYRYQAANDLQNSRNDEPQSLMRKATLNRNSSSKLKESLQQFKLERDTRLSKLMMPTFHLEKYGVNLIASLRHQGFLP